MPWYEKYPDIHLSSLNIEKLRTEEYLTIVSNVIAYVLDTKSKRGEKRERIKKVSLLAFKQESKPLDESPAAHSVSKVHFLSKN